MVPTLKLADPLEVVIGYFADLTHDGPECLSLRVTRLLKETI